MNYNTSSSVVNSMNEVIQNRLLSEKEIKV